MESIKAVIVFLIIIVFGMLFARMFQLVGLILMAIVKFIKKLYK